MINPTGFEADRREQAILRQLGSEGLVLWRRDHVWPSGDVVERQVVGAVAGEDGPDLFLATAWVTWGNTMNVRVNMRAPVSEICRRFLGSRGDPAARELHAPDPYDAAVAAVANGEAHYVAREADTKSAAYLLRLGPRGGGAKRLAVATATRDGDAVSAEVHLEVWIEDLVAWAAEEFGPARPASRL